MWGRSGSKSQTETEYEDSLAQFNRTLRSDQQGKSGPQEIRALNIYGQRLMTAIKNAKDVSFKFRTEVLNAANELYADYSDPQNQQRLADLMLENSDGRPRKLRIAAGIGIAFIGVAIIASMAALGIHSLGLTAPIVLVGMAIGLVVCLAGVIFAKLSGSKGLHTAMPAFRDAAVRAEKSSRFFAPVDDNNCPEVEPLIQMEMPEAVRTGRVKGSYAY